MRASAVTFVNVVAVENVYKKFLVCVNVPGQ